jgi:tetratricopeptide (TPR) repeat protein
MRILMRACMNKGKRSYLSPLITLLFLSAAITACDTDEGSGDVHASLGIEAYQAGRYDEGIAELQQAIEGEVSRYDLEEVYTVLGNSYDTLDLYNEAIDAYEKAIELNPDYYKAWVNLGITYRHIGDLDQAEEKYKKALSIEPDYAELHASIGALYIFKAEPELAIESLERSIELDSQVAVAHSNLALAYAMNGRFEEAEASLHQATVLGYDNWTVMQERIESLKAFEGEE